MTKEVEARKYNYWRGFIVASVGWLIIVVLQHIAILLLIR